MNKSRKTTIQTDELSELRTLTLGGYPQKIMIDGKYKNNPIVICLHGGPGSPVPFSEGCRGIFPEITEKLTLVCWDQLGCGINNHPIDDSFCIKNFTDMTADLIRETKRCFPENKLYLFGISWGSILAAYAAASPEADMLDGVFTYGQVICEMTFNSEVKKALEASKMPESKKKKLGAIMNERNIDNAKLIMSFIRKYTEGYVCKADKSAPIGSIIKGMLTSPDYCFKDFKAVAINGYMKNSSLMKELLEIDMRNVLENVKVPYFIMQGDKDIVTSTEMVKSFISETGNNNLSFAEIENSGHITGGSAMDKIIDRIVHRASS